MAPNDLRVTAIQISEFQDEYNDFACKRVAGRRGPLRLPLNVCALSKNMCKQGFAKYLFIFKYSKKGFKLFSHETRMFCLIHSIRYQLLCYLSSCVNS